MDLQTLFSAAMTNQDTCLDGFAFSRRKYIREFIEGRLRKISHHVSNSLAMLKRVKKQQAAAGAVFPEEEGEFGTPVKSGDGFPTWLKKKDRALLQAPLNQTKVNLTVAKDGSGNFTTINDALQAAPNSSTTRFVIYIKAGAYFEYIEVERRKTMIMFMGDGIGKTVIKGNRSVGAGWTTFRSSTVGNYNSHLLRLFLFISFSFLVHVCCRSRKMVNYLVYVWIGKEIIWNNLKKKNIIMYIK